MGAILFEETIYDPNRERERTSYLGNEGEHLHALDEYMLKPSPKTSGSIFNFNNAANDFKLTRTNSTTTPLSNMAQWSHSSDQSPTNTSQIKMRTYCR